MDYLVNRGYKLNFLKTQIQRASDISQNNALKPKPKQHIETVPFVITYNPALPNIILSHKNTNTLTCFIYLVAVKMFLLISLW